MSNSILALQYHLHALAREHNIQLIEDPTLPPEEARAFPEIRTVLVFPAITDDLYAVVLHEMGHIVHPAGHNPKNDRKPGFLQACYSIEEEDAAWAWAKSVAVIWTPAMESLHAWARETYRKNVTETFRAKIKSVNKPLTDWK